MNQNFVLLKRIPEVFKNLSDIYPIISNGQLSIFDDSDTITPLYQNDDRLTKYNPKEQRYRLLIDKDEINNFVNKLEKQDFCFDIETTSLDPLMANVVGISFALAPYNAVFIYCKEKYLSIYLRFIKTDFRK